MPRHQFFRIEITASIPGAWRMGQRWPLDRNHGWQGRWRRRRRWSGKCTSITTTVRDNLTRMVLFRHRVAKRYVIHFAFLASIRDAFAVFFAQDIQLIFREGTKADLRTRLSLDEPSSLYSNNIERRSRQSKSKETHTYIQLHSSSIINRSNEWLTDNPWWTRQT